MQKQIKTTSFQMDTTVAEYLDERLSVIERHMGAVADAARFEVELARDVRNQKTGEIWKAELQIRVPGGDYTRVVGTGSSINAAIDNMKDEALRKLRTRKEAHTSFVRRTGAMVKRMLRME
jgi:ribosome-associated translation inhibitor RaiA